MNAAGPRWERDPNLYKIQMRLSKYAMKPQDTTDRRGTAGLISRPQVASVLRTGAVELWNIREGCGSVKHVPGRERRVTSVAHEVLSAWTLACRPVRQESVQARGRTLIDVTICPTTIA